MNSDFGAFGGTATSTVAGRASAIVQFDKMQFGQSGTGVSFKNLKAEDVNTVLLRRFADYLANFATGSKNLEL